MAVGNRYFPQALTPLFASGLDVRPEAAAAVLTATQLGYAAGMFLLVPLGDRLPARRLSVALFTATAVALLGLMLGGSIGGMLLARTVAGSVGDALGWRAPDLVAAAVTALSAVALTRVLPAVLPPSRLPYRRLLAEPLRLLAAEPELRRSCLYQATAFAGFTAVWSAVTLLLTGPAYGYGASAAALLALVNLATMLCAPAAGRIVDRRGSDPVNLASLLGLLVAAALLAGGAIGGPAGLVALVAGTLLLDIAMQTGMVANVARRRAKPPDHGLHACA